jgi:hypothetical protein
MGRLSKKMTMCQQLRPRVILHMHAILPLMAPALYHSGPRHFEAESLRRISACVRACVRACALCVEAVAEVVGVATVVCVCACVCVFV